LFLLPAPGLASLPQLLSIRVIYTRIVISPRLIMAPFDRAAGKPLFFACLSKPAKRVTKNLFLHRSIVGAAAGVAEGEVHMKIARHSRVLDNVDCRANDKRRDTIRF
jgi:hypothetical protein